MISFALRHELFKSYKMLNEVDFPFRTHHKKKRWNWRLSFTFMLPPYPSYLVLSLVKVTRWVLLAGFVWNCNLDLFKGAVSRQSN